jgi:ferredoxin
MVFDDVMDLLIAAPEAQPIALVFSGEAAAAPPPKPKSGLCTLTVKDSTGASQQVQARCGDNLRKVLIANKYTVYEGMAKLTNCNGGGQCGTCVVKVSVIAASCTRATPRAHDIAAAAEHYAVSPAV